MGSDVCVTIFCFLSSQQRKVLVRVGDLPIQPVAEHDHIFSWRTGERLQVA